MIRSHEELDVYRMAFEAAMRVFEISRSFPREETYSLTDQMRRSSRSVCSNLAEAWRRRRYAAAFVSRLNDCEAEAAETQTWLRFAKECGYLDAKIASDLHSTYDNILGKLVRMIAKPGPVAFAEARELGSRGAEEMHQLDARRFDTPQAQRDQVREALGSALAAQADVAFAFIHGSFLTERPFHDIDIAVYLVSLDASQMSLRTLALAENLETAVFRANGVRPHPPIDVRPLNPAPLGFCYQVLRHGRLLSNRDDTLRTNWTAQTISRYLDIKPLFETALKEAMTTWD